MKYLRARHGHNGWWAHLSIGRWMFSLQKRPSPRRQERWEQGIRDEWNRPIGAPPLPPPYKVDHVYTDRWGSTRVGKPQ